MALCFNNYTTLYHITRDSSIAAQRAAFNDLIDCSSNYKQLSDPVFKQKFHELFNFMVVNEHTFYLTGSFAYGGLHEKSDIDFFVIENKGIQEQLKTTFSMTEMYGGHRAHGYVDHNLATVLELKGFVDIKIQIYTPIYGQKDHYNPKIGAHCAILYLAHCAMDRTKLRMKTLFQAYMELPAPILRAYQKQLQDVQHETMYNDNRWNKVNIFNLLTN